MATISGNESTADFTNPSESAISFFASAANASGAAASAADVETAA